MADTTLSISPKCAHDNDTVYAAETGNEFTEQRLHDFLQFIADTERLKDFEDSLDAMSKAHRAIYIRATELDDCEVCQYLKIEEVHRFLEIWYKDFLLPLQPFLELCWGPEKSEEAFGVAGEQKRELRMVEEIYHHGAVADQNPNTPAPLIKQALNRMTEEIRRRVYHEDEDSGTSGSLSEYSQSTHTSSFGRQNPDQQPSLVGLINDLRSGAAHDIDEIQPDIGATPSHNISQDSWEEYRSGLPQVSFVAASARTRRKSI